MAAQVLMCAIMIGLVVGLVEGAERRQISDQALEAALNDKRYLQRQLKCALEEGVCDPVGRKLKVLTPYLLRGLCPQCTPVEEKQVNKVLAYIRHNYPNDWTKMVAKYSTPSTTYSSNSTANISREPIKGYEKKRPGANQ